MRRELPTGRAAGSAHAQAPASRTAPACQHLLRAPRACHASSSPPCGGRVLWSGPRIVVGPPPQFNQYRAYRAQPFIPFASACSVRCSRQPPPLLLLLCPLRTPPSGLTRTTTTLPSTPSPPGCFAPCGFPVSCSPPTCPLAITAPHPVRYTSRAPEGRFWCGTFHRPPAWYDTTPQHLAGTVGRRPSARLRHPPSASPQQCALHEYTGPTRRMKSGTPWNGALLPGKTGGLRRGTSTKK